VNVAIASMALILSGCGGSSQSDELGAVSPEPTPTEVQVNLKAKESIQNQGLAYVDYNCSPKYETRVTDLGDGIVVRVKRMNVFNEAKFGIFNQNPDFGVVADEYFIDSDSTDLTYGNLAVRATYLASAYHNSLAGLYSDIYDIYTSELKSFQKDYTRFKVIADRAGKKLCPIAKDYLLGLQEINNSDLTKVQPIYDELVASWPAFKTWWAAVNQISENIFDRDSLEVEDARTPKCDEYPTADGKYVVVKCTVPPG
jgi:hypothetical protein